MTIFQIAKNRFAIGKKGGRAKYVVQAKGKKVTGVRGQRPVLDKRYKTTKGTAAIRAALKAGLAALAMMLAFGCSAAQKTAERKCLAADEASLKAKLAKGTTGSADAETYAIELTAGEVECALEGLFGLPQPAPADASN